MTTPRRLLALVSVCLVGAPLLLPAQEAQRVPAGQHPYERFAPAMQTTLRFVSDVSFAGGPNFHVKIYEWVIGPRQEVQSFPLEGFATIEVKAGEVETTVGGVTADHRAGEHWVVPEGATLSIRVKPDTGRGDNIVILHGVVLIRR